MALKRVYGLKTELVAPSVKKYFHFFMFEVQRVSEYGVKKGYKVFGGRDYFPTFASRLGARGTRLKSEVDLK